MCFVYAIGSIHNLNNKKYDECYIGVTKDLLRRWKYHTTSGYSVSRAIKKYKWIFEENMRCIYSGETELCFDIESSLRPFPFMGLNEASGGKGGKTNYSPERGRKISDALRGRVRSEEHRKNISSSKKGTFSGMKNPKAKIWKLVDPDGKETIILGNLQDHCDKLGLCWSVLKKKLGTVVGEISPKFRDNGDITIRVKREKTIGWKLLEETSKLY